VGLLYVLVGALVLVGVFTAVNLAYWSNRSRQEADRKDLARRLGTATEEGEARLFNAQVKDQLAESLGKMGAELDAHIRQAGNPYTMSGLFQRCVGFGVAGAVAGFIMFQHPAGVLIAPVVAYLPIILLKRASRKRANQISEQLPDSLDLVARSLQSGHGIADAIRMCAEEMNPPLSTEFARVYDEHNLGRDFREALEGFVERSPLSFDVKIFVSSVLLQRETGGNLVEILNNISKTIRDRFVFQAKVLALTAEARISALILGLLPFGVAAIIMWMRPEYLVPLVTDPLGRLMLGMVIVLFAAGMFVMRELAKVEV
jgi:tight adherence protein B